MITMATGPLNCSNLVMPVYICPALADLSMA